MHTCGLYSHGSANQCVAAHTLDTDTLYGYSRRHAVSESIHISGPCGASNLTYEYVGGRDNLGMIENIPF